MQNTLSFLLRQTYRIGKYNLISYLLLIFMLFLTLRITYSFFFPDFGEYISSSYLISYLRSISDAVILAIPYMLLRKRYRAFSFLFLFIVDLFLLSGIWYYRNFETVIPYTAFLMPENLNGLGPSILASIKMKDLLVVLPAIVFTVIYYKLLNPEIKETTLRKRLLYLILCLTFALPVQINAGRNNYVGYLGERISILRHYGLFHLLRFDMLSHKPCNQAELEEIKTFINPKSRRQSNHSGKRKNLILILTESFTSWPIGLFLDKEEITPNLNKLLKQDGTVYFPHVLPQTNGGRSSDAQLILNAGLLPLHSGAAAMIFGINKYYSIPKALASKGYKSYNFICDESNFWNQGTTSISYGFDHLFDKYQLGSTGKKLNDRQLFEATTRHLTQLQSPFYAQLVTFSTHFPYQASNCVNPNPSILNSKLPDKEVAYFLAAVQYTDKQIGWFIKELKRKGLYDNSIIIITGDHEDVTFNQFNGIGKVSLSDRFIPLIILNSPLCPNPQDAVIGQIDIYPSILDLMGVGDYAFTGLGSSVFEKIDDCAVFRTGEAIGKNSQKEIISRKRKSWQISDMIIRSDYFKTHELKSY